MPGTDRETGGEAAAASSTFPAGDGTAVRASGSLRAGWGARPGPGAARGFWG